MDAVASQPQLYETHGPLKGQPRLGRRDFLRVAGTGSLAAGAVASAPDRYNPVGEARAIPPIAIIGIALAGAALGYLAGEVVDHYTGDEGTLTGTEETQDLHAELQVRTMEMWAADDTILTVIQNRIEDSYNVAWSKAKVAAIEALNGGETEAVANTNAEAVVDDYYSVIQKNLLNRFTEIVNKMVNIASLDVADVNLDHVVFQADWDGVTFSLGAGSFGSQTQSITLFDGSTLNVEGLWIDGSFQQTEGVYFAGATNWNPSTQIGAITPLTSTDVVGQAPNFRAGIKEYSSQLVDVGFRHSLWANTWDSLTAAHTQMIANVGPYVTNLYQTAAVGDYDTSAFLDPVTLASELATDYESTGWHAYAAAEAAVLGIPGDVEHSMNIELVETDVTVLGTLWTNWEPGGGFAVDTHYDPATTTKPVYLSYEYRGDTYLEEADLFVQDANGNYVKDETVTTASAFEQVTADHVQVGFTQLDEPFIIRSATNLTTGESVNTVTLESSNYQTTDVTLTQEELEALLELRQLLRDSENTAGSTGGGLGDWSFAGISGEGLLLIGTGLVALLIGSNR